MTPGIFFGLIGLPGLLIAASFACYAIQSKRDRQNHTS